MRFLECAGTVMGGRAGLPEEQIRIGATVNSENGNASVIA
jgi:hypothetical protein